MSLSNISINEKEVGSFPPESCDLDGDLGFPSPSSSTLRVVSNAEVDSLFDDALPLERRSVVDSMALLKLGLFDRSFNGREALVGVEAICKESELPA